jgi:hypothetical protein
MKTKFYQNNGNKLIADFMQLEKCFAREKDRYGYTQTIDGYKLNEFTQPITEEQLKYDSSFDWLMSVWEKIANMQPENNIIIKEMIIGTRSCSISASEEKTYKNPHEKHKRFTAFNVIGDPIEDGTLENLIDTVFVSIVEFIGWYNKNK